MARRIRWIGIGMVLCFVVLFLQLNNLQVLKASQYANNKYNPQVEAARFDQTRGVIQSADGVVLAQSVPTPNATYAYGRIYPTGALFSQVVGVFSYVINNYGVEASYNSDLLSHNRPVKTIGDLFSTRTVTDNVTLTLSDKLQTDAMNALAGRDGAIVVLDPSTGAVEAMYSNPSYDPNPLVIISCTVKLTSKGTCPTESVAQQAFNADNVPDVHGFRPFTSLAYQDIFPPGSTFKVVTGSAAYEHTPPLANTPVPSFSCIPPQYFAGQTTQLCNFSGPSGPACGGTVADMLPPSCDTGFAILGTKVGAASMTAEADAFGFNQQPPIDLPHGPNEVSEFLQPACYENAQVFLAFSSIGQKCTIATPLQMALVAAGIANGGVVMTPHVMSQIRDSQGNLVTTYTPKPWKKATSSQTATEMGNLMTQVVRSGTASQVGFPANEDVAAKTGTAQVGTANTLTTDWMIAFAPANAPRVAIAVAMPFQPRDETGAVVAGPIMKTMIADALANP